MRTRRAFTLIELLVVIAIIIALLAILLPSMGRAINVATLAKCGSNLKQIAVGVTSYAADNQGRFPDRDGFGKPTGLKNTSLDHRKLVRNYVAINLLQCPLSPRELDFEEDPTPAQFMEVNYGFWWDWKFDNTGGYTEQGLTGVAAGSFSYRGHRFQVLAGDWESIGLADEISECSHNDRNGSMPEWTLDNESFGGYVHKFSRWNQWVTGAGRGPVDKNFVFTDMSVQLYNGLDLEHTNGPFVNVPAMRGFATTWSTFLPTSR